MTHFEQRSLTTGMVLTAPPRRCVALPVRHAIAVMVPAQVVATIIPIGDPVTIAVPDRVEDVITGIGNPVALSQRLDC
jgi:hypothetical protein